ncbi:Serine carboxypeptidase [Pseudobythopirellula maris]|uniref:Serine carboxypeptidase n=1 Tax=Pseudobythopirellula maris TaxID=2527991 RepID=A0A5C5ZGH2_9BACT|nr:peptidase S10 [Pseudobythopirellula maris]TWT86157.1 Serine carboxypeptidase [Pseudobythopirellula maris]
MPSTIPSLRWLASLAFAAVILCGPAPARADDAPKDEAKAGQAKSDKGEEKSDDQLPPPVVSEHKTTIAGKEIAYRATTGKMAMKNDAGEEKAHIFYIAYERTDGVDDQQDGATERPITFCFNGGPGSSSVWLHMGMLGPKRVIVPDDASTPAPPYRAVANPFSLLDVTDLVFIDPVSTGFSRPAEGEKKDQFHGYKEDLRSVGQFIHDYTTKQGRWASPKFVLGESYGGLRTAGLCGTLQERYRMYLSGVVLVSAVVDFSTLAFDDNNDRPYLLFLPSYTATAHYHKALGEELQALTLEEVVARAEEFAYGPYANALLRGDSLPQEEFDAVVAEYSRLTGLGERYVRDSNLRVRMWNFGKELLRDRGKTVGRYDGRFTGLDRTNAGESYDYDPSGAAIDGLFAGALYDYLRNDLGYEEERVYEVLTGDVRPWNYKPFTNSYVDASETLRKGMTINPHLKAFAACGYYDLATPQFAMKYTRDHLMLAPELRENFTMKFYEGGHMMYVYEPALKQLRADLVEFYESATPTQE